MTKILVYGEGPHDIGFSRWNVRRGDHDQFDGWLQPMVRQLCPAGEVEARSLQQLITFPARAGAPSLSSALAKKAGLARLAANTGGFAAVVFATDADSPMPKSRKQKLEDIEAGFAAFPGDASSVACVPMGTSEAWLLADTGAWTALGAKDISKHPPKPETCWGKAHDPNSSHPKMLFAKICEANDIENHSGTRAGIAEASDMQVLRALCPASFPEFADKVAEI